ncbi:MAG: NAD-dependent epimerase/dehydratase family protein [Alphaproteobacteria bacterium]
MVAGTGRTPGVRAGVTVSRFDREAPLEQPESALAGTTHVLLSVPPDAEGDPALDLHGGDLVRCAGGSLAWIGYLSTTGVYGDRGGGWVDETVPVRPGSERARRRAAAEASWLAFGRDRGVPVQIFRLPGIYGPGRSQIEAVRAGRAHRIDKPGQVFSRIHVDDIVAVLRASMARPRAGAVYNVADDLPAPSHDVTAFACDLLGVEPPPLVPYAAADLSPMARSFYAESRRVANRLIKAELGVTLRYPDYRAGLRAILAGEAAA